MDNRVRSVFPDCDAAFLAALRASKSAFMDDSVLESASDPDVHMLLGNFANEYLYGFDADESLHVLRDDLAPLVQDMHAFIVNQQAHQPALLAKIHTYTDHSLLREHAVPMTLAAPQPLLQSDWLLRNDSPLVVYKDNCHFTESMEEFCELLAIFFVIKPMHHVVEQLVRLGLSYAEAEQRFLAAADVIFSLQTSPRGYMHIGFLVAFQNYDYDPRCLNSPLMLLVLEKYNNLMQTRNTSLYATYKILRRLQATRAERPDTSMYTSLWLRKWLFVGAETHPLALGISGNSAMSDQEERAVLEPLLAQMTREKDALAAGATYEALYPAFANTNQDGADTDAVQMVNDDAESDDGDGGDESDISIEDDDDDNEEMDMEDISENEDDL